MFECPDFVSWIKNNSYQKSPWCKIENSALSLIRNILKYDPSQRLTIRQIKSSQWFVRVHKTPFETMAHNPTDISDESMPFLSQPIHFYFNEPSNRMLGAEVTDSQQNCDCSSSADMHSIPAHFESFSQPISTENMILNSQAHTQSIGSSQYSQSPFLKLVKRMTRMFVHTSVDGCFEELKKLFESFRYDYKVCITNQRQRQLTVSTSDKRMH